MARIEVPGHEVVGLRADNPGPFSLTGTNTWITGAGPAWLVDPGPALDAHVQSLEAELRRRGGLGGIALTHDHADHNEAVPMLRGRFPDAPVAAARGAVDVVVADGESFGPLRALATPGHAPDHLAWISGSIGFCGDAVLGQGSVFVAPDPGALVGYLEGLGRLRELDLEFLCPGHGPLITDPAAKLDEYVSHRLQRERRLVAALDSGARSVDELLDAAWSEVPDHLRPAAAVTLASHLDKLEGERRLPDGVQRPDRSALRAH